MATARVQTQENRRGYRRLPVCHQAACVLSVFEVLVIRVAVLLHFRFVCCGYALLQ